MTQTGGHGRLTSSPPRRWSRARSGSDCGSRTPTWSGLAHRRAHLRVLGRRLHHVHVHACVQGRAVGLPHERRRGLNLLVDEALAPLDDRGEGFDQIHGLVEIPHPGREHLPVRLHGVIHFPRSVPTLSISFSVLISSDAAYASGLWI